MQKESSDGLTTGEQIYLGVVSALALLCLVSLANLHLYIIPKLSEDGPGPSPLVMTTAMLWIFFIALVGTTAVNVMQRKLNTISTVLQIVVLFLTCWGIPLGIWGIVLLRQRWGRAGEVR